MARDFLQNTLVRQLVSHPSWIERLGPAILPVISNSVLASFAAGIARTRALKWYPGWKFGDGEFAGDQYHQLRLYLWKYFQAKRPDAPFSIAWYDGLRVTMYLGNDMSLCLYVAGTYEPNEFMFLGQVLRPGMTFIDVGANDGLYTLFASSRVGVTGRVVALEPSSREFARLQRNLRLNGLTNVAALRQAASDRSGVASLRLAEFGHEGLNTLGEFAYSIEQQASEEVSLITLDSLIASQNLSRVDFLKMDVEGGELNALKGAQSVLATHKPLILIEIVEAALKHQGASRDSVLDFLQSFGYRFLIFGPNGRPEPVSAVTVDGVNIVAMHRERTVSF
jgi:FkbM family methyltransferase